MCGRFHLTLTDLGIVRERFDVGSVQVEAFQPRYNVAPSQPAPIVTNEESRVLACYRWGLVPRWAKDPSIGYRTINARVESVAEKPSFRDAFKRRRCVVPTTGFYEWQVPRGGGPKVPMAVRPKDGELMPLAGLYETWISAEGEILDSFSILTREAVGPLRDVHARMPFELPPQAIDLWLAPQARTARDLAPVLREPAKVDHLEVFSVSSRVNSPVHDDPDCLLPALPPARRQLSLFD